MHTTSGFTILFLPAVVVALPACTGSGVTTSAIEGGFGPVASAAWIRKHYGADVSEGLVLTNVSGFCEKYNAMTDALVAFRAAIDAMTTADTTCSSLTDPFLDAVDAAAAMYPPATNLLLLDTVFSPGAHQVGDDAGGRLETYSGLSASSLSEPWDPAGSIETHCGLPESPIDFLSPDPETELEIWSGVLRIASVTETSLDGSFKGALEGDGGAISAHFQAEPCEFNAPE